jgi:hypothetical protein
MVERKRASKGGIIKRKAGLREVALFIDGTALDRATRRLRRKIDMSALIRGVTSGLEPKIARYYTIIPYEDDSRHRSFLDAVRSAGLDVIVKRLPPKGITRQVSVDLEMAVDMIAYGLGHKIFKTEFTRTFSAGLATGNGAALNGNDYEGQNHTLTATASEPIQKVVTVICPSRELSYPMELLKEQGIDTTSVDFGKFNSGDILKSAAKWIDLSDSETIWRDS